MGTVEVMSGSGRRRAERRAASQAAILAAASSQFAGRGPDGAPLRDVAEQAGCTHALITRYFGSKQGLEEAVATRFAEQLDGRVRAVLAESEDPLRELMGAARAHRPVVQLLVRTALGDLPQRGLPACLHVDELLAAGVDRRSRWCAYGAGALVLGFLTLEGFLVAATGLSRLSAGRRDDAVTAAARLLLRVAEADEPRLARRELAVTWSLAAPTGGVMPTSREALLAAAIELFAQQGPASVSVRDIARRAGANQALIYRHFGSKEGLLAAAIESGSSGMFAAAMSADGFDYDGMSWLLHHASPAPRLLARTLVDGIDISSVRRQFPIVRRLVDDVGAVPSGAGPGDLSDPRVAAMATASLALGSAVWGSLLLEALGLRATDGRDAVVADLARVLMEEPRLRV
jgi:AcrR family transcriptional regulator